MISKESHFLQQEERSSAQCTEWDGSPLSLKPAQIQGDEVPGGFQTGAQDFSCLSVTSCWVQQALLAAEFVLNMAFTKGRFLCECVGHKFYCNPCAMHCQCCLAFQATPSGHSFPAFPHCSTLLF